MAIRNILTSEDPVLRKTSRPVTNFDKRLHILLDDMADTLREAAGAGLAAPQVGVLRRVCIVDLGDDDGLTELVNPEIVSAEGRQEGREGCLSVPGVAAVVARPERVTVRARDRRGNEFTTTGEGLRARAYCHEIDHLDGKLYTEDVIRYLTEEEMAEGGEE
ncbi:MAG: peptide deformylase [Oscillospiraceae bacterium]|nr:peptide deformylase [Oscillospiraceae bacterium]